MTKPDRHHYHGPVRLEDLPKPPLELNDWKLSVQHGHNPPFASLSIEDISSLPRKRIRCTFPCSEHSHEVEWEGIDLALVLEKAGGILEYAGGIVIEGRDNNWVRVPISDLRDGNILLAFSIDGKKITHERGGPVRIIHPFKGEWKSLKWPKLAAFVSDRTYVRSIGHK